MQAGDVNAVPTVRPARAWVLGFVAYALAWAVSGFALDGILAGGGLAAFDRWSWILAVAPGVVGAAAAVLAAPSLARPTWRAGLVGSAGALAAAVLITVLGWAALALRPGSTVSLAVALPVVATALASVVMGAIRAHAWTPPSGAEPAYTAAASDRRSS